MGHSILEKMGCSNSKSSMKKKNEPEKSPSHNSSYGDDSMASPLSHNSNLSPNPKPLLNLSYAKPNTANSAVTFTINPLSKGEYDLEEIMPAVSPPPRLCRPKTSSWDYFDACYDLDSFRFVGGSEQAEIDCDGAVTVLEKLSQGNVAKCGSDNLQDSSLKSVQGKQSCDDGDEDDNVT